MSHVPLMKDAFFSKIATSDAIGVANYLLPHLRQAEYPLK
jgi:hypothetical protein